MATRKTEIPWSPDDYIGGTRHLSLEERGAYVELLMLQYSRGGQFTLEQAKKAIGETFPQVWAAISDKFQTDNDVFWNARMRVAMGKAKPTKAATTKKANPFVKPVLAEVVEYFKYLGLNGASETEAEKFVDYYESKGWVVGKSPMLDWRACCRTWKRNTKTYTNKNGQGNIPFWRQPKNLSGL